MSAYCDHNKFSIISWDVGPLEHPETMRKYIIFFHRSCTQKYEEHALGTPEEKEQSCNCAEAHSQGNGQHQQIFHQTHQGCYQPRGRRKSWNNSHEATGQVGWGTLPRPKKDFAELL